ncbi:hypothetical protein [Micromonospora sp. NPDC050695]|uniref:hypothetical protein n=1 Tax=Micromonospora sp. NPDC050695 TaxID=3154938 RepID=UPI0033E2FE35
MVTVPDNQAWCADCNENDDPRDYVGGVHISQVELPDTDPWAPAADFDLDALLDRVAADTLRELEATTDLDARFAAVIAGDAPGADGPPTDNPELAVLEAVYFDTPIDRTDELVNFDVVNAVKAASAAGLIRADFDHTEFGWRITEAGEKRLAGLWGDDRVPPGKGGHVDCWMHGVYIAAPGDLWTCPEDTRTDDVVLRDLAADPVIGGAMVLADAEAQRAVVEPKLRRSEASRRRRKAIRKAARMGVLAAAVLTVLWLLATAAL